MYEAKTSPKYTTRFRHVNKVHTLHEKVTAHTPRRVPDSLLLSALVHTCGSRPSPASTPL
jgi:hypothetical protein